jgi:hypothetical protein
MGLFQPYLKTNKKDEYKITLLIISTLGEAMYAQNFQKILYGMKSLMIIYTSKQRYSANRKSKWHCMLQAII